METKDEFKEIDIKNRACYYFDDIIKDKVFNFSDTLLDEKLYEIISVYDITKLQWVQNHCVLGFIK